MYKDTALTEIDNMLQRAWAAYEIYRNISINQRAAFMYAVALALENSGDELIQIAARETHLPEARLRNERSRTVFQLSSYGEACERGDWLEARIDTAIPHKDPPKPDIRKMLIPVGPVVVFGSSNFPFAFSTAGGDTATAFAAGCPVIVKAHPAHAETSTRVAQLILKVVEECSMPDGLFMHVYGAAFEVGETLVKHPLTKAVGFTGSYTGGKQLFDWGNQRAEPIPVFAEMSSINPVFLMPEKLKASVIDVARMFVASITLGVGQFCTNPGLIIGIDGDDLEQFIAAVSAEIKSIAPARMLHAGIAKMYAEKKSKALAQDGVTAAAGENPAESSEFGTAAIATVNAKTFLSNPILHQEVFGPYSLIVRCSDSVEMIEVAKRLEGQLTCTLIATENELKRYDELMQAVKNICGRMIFNNVPTGVEACLSMQHGGPFPATSDSRFTSVGADGIKRFARPVAFQNWPDALLPHELQNENPLGIYRTVNNVLTRGKITK